MTTENLNKAMFGMTLQSCGCKTIHNVDGVAIVHCSMHKNAISLYYTLEAWLLVIGELIRTHPEEAAVLLSLRNQGMEVLAKARGEA